MKFSWALLEVCSVFTEDEKISLLPYLKSTLTLHLHWLIVSGCQCQLHSQIILQMCRSETSQTTSYIFVLLER